MEPHHTIYRKSNKTVVDYTNHSLVDLLFVVVSPSPSLTSSEKDVIQLSLRAVVTKYPYNL